VSLHEPEVATAGGHAEASAAIGKLVSGEDPVVLLYPQATRLPGTTPPMATRSILARRVTTPPTAPASGAMATRGLLAS